MPKILLYSTGGFGDALVFTHLATLLRDQINGLSLQIDFALNHDFAFQFGNGNNQDAVEILALQHGIHTMCIFNRHTGIIKYPDGKTLDIREPSPYDKIYVQQAFFSDLTYTQSMFLDFIKEYGTVPNLSETSFRLNKLDIVPSKFNIEHIAVPGELDWKNKWKGQDHKVKELYTILEKRGYKTHVIGPENGKSYLENLKILSQCNLYIGPFGSIGHCAAGLNVNTITLSSIFSPVWDNPAYYHSGFHKAIICKPQFHCGDFKCISPKLYTQPRKNNPDFLGPPIIEWNTPWVEKCKYTESGQSCVSSVELEDFVKALDEWEERVDYKNSKI